MDSRRLGHASAKLIVETSPPSRGPAELPIFRAEQPRKGPLLQSPTHFSRRKVLQSAKLLRLPSMSVNFTPGESQRRVLRDDQVSSNIHPPSFSGKAIRADGGEKFV